MIAKTRKVSFLKNYRHYSQNLYPFSSNSTIKDFSLYLVTDSSIAKQKNYTTEQIVRDAIYNGATCVQYREKNPLISSRDDPPN